MPPGDLGCRVGFHFELVGLFVGDSDDCLQLLSGPKDDILLDIV